MTSSSAVAFDLSMPTMGFYETAALATATKVSPVLPLRGVTTGWQNGRGAWLQRTGERARWFTQELSRKVARWRLFGV